jgi:hypothetical protein
MDGKRKILIPHCIHVASKKKHGNVGGKSAFQEQKTKLGAPCFAMLLARCNLDAMGKTCNQDPPLSIHRKFDLFAKRLSICFPYEVRWGTWVAA